MELVALGLSLVLVPGSGHTTEYALSDAVLLEIFLFITVYHVFCLTKLNDDDGGELNLMKHVPPGLGPFEHSSL